MKISQEAPTESLICTLVDDFMHICRSSTNHEHDQPPHLRLHDPEVPEAVNLPQFGGPESRYCPARVYEYALFTQPLTRK